MCRNLDVIFLLHPPPGMKNANDTCMLSIHRRMIVLILHVYVRIAILISVQVKVLLAILSKTTYFGEKGHHLSSIENYFMCPVVPLSLLLWSLTYICKSKEFFSSACFLVRSSIYYCVAFLHSQLSTFITTVTNIIDITALFR